MERIFSVFGTPSGFQYQAWPRGADANPIRKFDGVGFPPTMPVLGQAWVFFRRPTDSGEVCGIGLLVRVYEATELRSGGYCGVGYIFRDATAEARLIVSSLREFSQNVLKAAIDPASSRFLANSFDALPRFEPLSIIVPPQPIFTDQLTNLGIQSKRWLVDCRNEKVESALADLLKAQAYMTDCVAFLAEDDEALSAFKGWPTQTTLGLSNYLLENTKRIREETQMRLDQARRQKQAAEEERRRQEALERQRQEALERQRQEALEGQRQDAQRRERESAFSPNFFPNEQAQEGRPALSQGVSSQDFHNGLLALERKLRDRFHSAQPVQETQARWLDVVACVVIALVLVVASIFGSREISSYFEQPENQKRTEKLKELEEKINQLEKSFVENKLSASERAQDLSTVKNSPKGSTVPTQKPSSQAESKGR